jgi:phospholipase/carboxylesterase
VPDPNNTSLIHYNGWTLRIREAAARPSRILLLLHGYTGDENSMWLFTQNLPPRYWMIAPRAPHLSGTDGYSWRPVQSFDLGKPSLEQLLPAAEALIRLVDEMQASARMDASPEHGRRIDVMGFSQGAAMSNVLAFLYPERIRKVGILAGFVPAGLEEHAAKRPLEGKTVFVTHGARDPMIPIQRARSSIEILQQAGAQIVYCEDDVGHKVSLNCLRALRSYLED